MFEREGGERGEECKVARKRMENEGGYLRSLLGACVPGTFRCFSFDLPPQLRALLCEQLSPSQIVDYGIGTC